MNIQGKHTITAPASIIWALLQDPEVLARITPGISRLEVLGTDQYKAISEISIGPVRGSFAGDLEVRDKVEEEKMTLALDLKSKIGNASAEIQIQLSPVDENSTEVSYTGSAQLSGTIARLGQRIMGGVVTTMSRQVFKDLEKEIALQKDKP